MNPRRRMEPLHRDTEARAEITREGIKSLFRIVCGRPDSITKIFRKSIALEVGDLQELDLLLQDKLHQYVTEAVVTSVSINFEKNIIKDFSGLQDFEQYVQNRPEQTEALTMRWDILINVPEYLVPQRHTITLRVAEELKPSDVFQYMRYVFSEDPEDVDKLDLEMAPMFCRVDFIDLLIAQEMVNIVVDWHDGRVRPVIYSSFYHKLRRHREKIAKFIHNSLPFLISLLAGAALFNIPFSDGTEQPITVSQMQVLMLWLLASSLAIYTARGVGYWLARRSHNALERFGSSRVFKFTRGDINKVSEIEQTNRDAAHSFIWNTVVAFSIDIIAGIIVALLLNTA